MPRKSAATSHQEEIDRLKTEIACLKVKAAAKPLESTTGVYVLNVPATTTVNTYKHILAFWREVWVQRGVEPPPALVPIPTDVSIEQVTYNGFGMFILRVPDDTPGELAERWAYAWDLAWRTTETPDVPMVIMAQSLDMQKLSDQQLRAAGLVRIPDQRVGHA